MTTAEAMALPATMGRRESVGRWHCCASTLARPGFRVSDLRCMSSPRGGGGIGAVTDGFLDGAVFHNTAGQNLVQRLTGTLTLDISKVATDGRRVVDDALELAPGQSTACALGQQAPSRLSYSTNGKLVQQLQRRRGCPRHWLFLQRDGRRLGRRTEENRDCGQEV